MLLPFYAMQLISAAMSANHHEAGLGPFTLSVHRVFGHGVSGVSPKKWDDLVARNRRQLIPEYPREMILHMAPHADPEVIGVAVGDDVH